MTRYYRGVHRDQFDGSKYQSSNCVPTTVANGTRVVTAGVKDHSGAYVRSLIPRWQEQNPFTPGWSLDDAKKACAKLGVGYSIHDRFTGASWAQMLDFSDRGYVIQAQGKSSVFTEGCSSKFDGGHSILIHPDRYQGLILIGDPICTSWRFERAVKLQQYVEALYGKSHIRYGLFTTPAPILAPDTDTDEIPQETDVKVTAVKGEDWRAINGNGVYRASPERGLTPVGKLPNGAIVRTITEASTPDKNLWRLTEIGGKPAWLIVKNPDGTRSDWEPVVQGGDPAVDQGLTDYIARKP